ncbi:hypothetical protein [Micromonospora echinofusca]|uniref:MYXO-CTERM domain-containing protein n=1 Tax=Micromonospora echinofusca TaxID=47858 RepID=A0ABS3VX91_MICEH|nr:hypothetical protein [Micromonospora echinofusca]MBO4209152.1 hypothetical protein [Micromonospora echinofusca]
MTELRILRATTDPQVADRPVIARQAEVTMRWLVFLIILVAVGVTVWLWRRSRRVPPDIDSQLRHQQASNEARKQFDEHRNRSGSSGAHGFGAWDM